MSQLTGERVTVPPFEIFTCYCGKRCEDKKEGHACIHASYKVTCGAMHPIRIEYDQLYRRRFRSLTRG